MVIYLNGNVYIQRCEDMKSMKINGRNFSATGRKREQESVK